LKTFATGYLKGRHDLGVRTADKYQGLLELHILPELGDLPLNKITPSTVRSWNAGTARRLPSTAAGTYRLLSMMMRSAVTDEIITRNPCQVKGASVEKSPERPIATVAEVKALADAVTDKLGVAVLLSAWCQLRRGELLGLRRRDIDLLRRVLTVSVTRGPTRNGTELVKPPKTDAGRRTIALPANIVPDLERHLSTYVGPGPDSWVIDVQPRTLDRAWVAARKSIGRKDLHLHDLRHTGLTLAAATGPRRPN
jgi:integrase